MTAYSRPAQSVYITISHEQPLPKSKTHCSTHTESHHHHHHRNRRPRCWFSSAPLEFSFLPRWHPQIAFVFQQAQRTVPRRTYLHTLAYLTLHKAPVEPLHVEVFCCFDAESREESLLLPKIAFTRPPRTTKMITWVLKWFQTGTHSFGDWNKTFRPWAWDCLPMPPRLVSTAAVS